MKKKELVYREILFQAMEKKNRTLTQADLARGLSISLSTVNNALKVLERMNAIKINKRNFNLVDLRKILYYWASVRNLEKDVVWSARIGDGVETIEAEMPDAVVFTCYSGYKFKFKEIEADYSEVYVYGDKEKLIKRFKRSIVQGPPNLIVLKKTNEERYGKTATIANLFVDLWNVREWYARDFLNGMEGKING